MPNKYILWSYPGTKCHINIQSIFQTTFTSKNPNDDRPLRASGLWQLATSIPAYSKASVDVTAQLLVVVPQIKLPEYRPKCKNIKICHIMVLIRSASCCSPAGSMVLGQFVISWALKSSRTNLSASFQLMAVWQAANGRSRSLAETYWWWLRFITIWGLDLLGVLCCFPVCHFERGTVLGVWVGSCVCCLAEVVCGLSVCVWMCWFSGVCLCWMCRCGGVGVCWRYFWGERQLLLWMISNHWLRSE